MKCISKLLVCIVCWFRCLPDTLTAGGQPWRRNRMKTIDKNILLDRMRVLNDAMPMALAFALVNAVILVWVNWSLTGKQVAWAWLAALFLVSAVRLGLLVSYVKDSNRHINIERYYGLTIAGIIVAGAVWGSSVYLIHVSSQVFDVFHAFVLGGISAGAVTTLYSSRVASLGFLSLTVVPLAAHLVAEADNMSRMMGALLFLFYAGMAISASRAYRTYNENLRVARIASTVPEMEERINITAGLLDDKNRLLENYTQMLVQKSDAILGFDMNMSLNYWDDGAENMFGYTGDEVLGKPAMMLCDTDAEPCLNEQMIPGLIENNFSEIEPRLRSKDGKFFYVRASVVLVRSENGKPESAIAYLADIDELKKTELALRESEQKYKSVVESLPMGMFICQLTGSDRLVFTGYNNAASKILASDCSSFIGRSFEECFPSLADTELPKSFRHVINTGEPWSSDNVVYEQGGRKGGYTVNAFRISSGVVAVMFADISDRLEAERAIRKSESRLNFLLTSSPVVIYTSQVAGDFAATYISPNVQDLFGFEPEQFLADPHFWANNIHPDDRERVLSDLSMLMEHDRHTHEYRFLLADGHYCWVHDELRLLRNEAGEPSEIIGYWADVTERVQAEQIKDEFIATVSHELRTPLTSIHGALGLVIGGAAGKLDRKALEMIAIASSNSERLLRLINDILDIQRLDGRRVQFNFETVSLLPWLDKVLQDNKPFADESSVGFLIDRPEKDFHVTVDPDRLTQVMTNLLSNAIKFSPAGGMIKIRLKQAGHSIRVSVADNGPGVPETFSPHLFDRFTQADRTNTRNYSGTGLGLSIAKSIIEQLGGEIGYEPGAGGGSVFWFQLPLSDSWHHSTVVS